MTTTEQTALNTRERMVAFRDIAYREGYTVKIVGAYAYRRPRRRRGRVEIIRLVSLKDAALVVQRVSTTGGY